MTNAVLCYVVRCSVVDVCRRTASNFRVEEQAKQARTTQRASYLAYVGKFLQDYAVRQPRIVLWKPLPYEHLM
jgi:hypothetical protein